MSDRGPLEIWLCGRLYVSAMWHKDANTMEITLHEHHYADQHDPVDTSEGMQWYSDDTDELMRRLPIDRVPPLLGHEHGYIRELALKRLAGRL